MENVCACFSQALQIFYLLKQLYLIYETQMHATLQTHTTKQQPKPSLFLAAQQENRTLAVTLKIRETTS